MLYEESPAPASLQPFVTHFWLVHGQAQTHYEKILPGPSAHLILNLSTPYRLIDPEKGSAVEVPTGFYAGLQRGYLISENPSELFNVGARLTAFGLGAFTERAPVEVQGTVSDADDVFPGFSALRRQLPSPEPDEAFAALASFLQSRLRPGRQPDERVRMAVETLMAEDLPVHELAERLGISLSTLERTMMRDCGVTAKAYSDVCRFYRFVNAAAALPPGATIGRELLGLADYYDQPHLVRTFRRFSGYTPSEYLEVVRTYGSEFAVFVPVQDIHVAGFVQDNREARR